MPLQHASDKLLRSMKRGRDSQFLDRAAGEAPRARARASPSAPRSSPGSRARPRRTSSCSRSSSSTQRFERMGCFQYSDEEGTAALRLRGQGAAEDHRAALARGHGHPEAHQPRAEQELIGKRLEVLVEGPSPETEHLLVGRHEGQAPDIDGQVYINDGLGLPGRVRHRRGDRGPRLRPGRPGGGAPRAPGRRLGLRRTLVHLLVGCRPIELAAPVCDVAIE